MFLLVRELWRLGAVPLEKRLHVFFYKRCCCDVICLVSGTLETPLVEETWVYWSGVRLGIRFMQILDGMEVAQ